MKAINRLIYTITKGNKPNQTDIDALNDVIRYYNSERDRQFVNNRLFAKMYISTFKNDLIKNNGNYKLITESLRSTCQISLEDQLDGLIRESNAIYLQNEFDNYIGDIDKFEYPKYKPEAMKEKLKDVIVNLIEDYNHYE